MDQLKEAYPYKRILFSLKKGNPAVFDNMDDLEDTTLSEISQSQVKYCRIPLIGGI